MAQSSRLQMGHHLALIYSTAALILLPLPLLLNTSYLGHTWQTYGCILLMALITQMLGHTCVNWAMKWVSPTLVSILLLTEPLIASGLGYVAFRELPTLYVALGGAIVLLGVAISIFYQGVSQKSLPSSATS